VTKYAADTGGHYIASCLKILFSMQVNDVLVVCQRACRLFWIIAADPVTDCVI